MPEKNSGNSVKRKPGRPRKNPESESSQNPCFPEAGLEIPRFFTAQIPNLTDWMLERCEKREVPPPEGTESGRSPRKMLLPKTMSDNAAMIATWHYAKRNNPGDPESRESSWIEMCNRLSETWTEEGIHAGMFRSRKSARNFQLEIQYLLFTQSASPNSPQWFNTGIGRRYNVTGSVNAANASISDAEGKWGFAEIPNGKAEHHPEGECHPLSGIAPALKPMASACFILSLQDNLTGKDGIADLYTRESRIFQSGGGAGTNFSRLRAEGEALSGGGTSSGLVSFLRWGDTAAGALKSGGNSRRAAKMVVVDSDHPEILDVVNWKVKEELKREAMILGDQFLRETLEREPNSVSDGMKLGIRHLKPLDHDWRGEAARTIQGQNANISIRVKNRDLPKEILGNNARSDTIELKGRVSESKNREISKEDLWRNISEAAWACADPGLQFADTINAWNPNDWRKFPETEIRSTNPCAEFIYVDDSACNLASLHLGKYENSQALAQATRLWITVLEITVRMASYPSEAIARNSRDHRPLGLGIANLGGWLMQQGIPYDSPEGRNLAAQAMAVIHGAAAQMSMEIARNLGPCQAWVRSRKHAEKIWRRHHNEAQRLLKEIAGNSGTSENLRDYSTTIKTVWDDLMKGLPEAGLRNMQLTAIAPTGTIALLMDCTTTGMEPELSLSKMKTLAGGGTMRIANNLVGEGLRSTGKLEESQIQRTVAWLETTGSLQVDESPDGTRNPLSGDLESLREIFLCAFPAVAQEKVLSPESHIYMVSALQPFISGTASKTVNLPRETSPEKIQEIYMKSWEIGLKCVSVYRDGSKGDQPIHSGAGAGTGAESPNATPSLFQPRVRERRKLPSPRQGMVWKAYIGGQGKGDKGHKLYLRTGHYEDGTIGEIWLDTHRESPILRSFHDALAMSVSLGLQYGIPLREFTKMFVGMQFEPSGMVREDDEIKMANSSLDFYFRKLDVHYNHRYDLANVPPIREKGQKSIQPTQPLVLSGYTGDLCPNCGSPQMRRTGTCLYCEACNQSTGCS